MTIRHITRDEYDIANDIKYIAFLKSPAPQKNDADDPDAIYSSIVGYFDDGGTMTARIRNMAYEAFFEGERVPIGAICAVASSPEARGRGRIRELFQYALKEDSDRGALFSTLFPFSHGYYRNLGYELCAHLQKVRVPIEELRGFAGMPCAAKLHRLSDGFDVIRQIEARMFQPYNPCMLLTDRQYKKALGGDPVLHGDYRYILSDPDGTPCAYVYFTAQSHQGQTIAAVDALAYTHLSALQRTLGFLYGLRAQYAYVELPLPMDADLLQMLPEPKRAEVCIVPHGMARLVHTQEALRRMRHPAGTGAYTVRVLDPICPFNEGTYTVSYENGCVSASRTQLQPDLIADVGTFTQLVLGTYALDSVLWKDSVSLLQNEQTLRAVFVQRPTYFPRHF